MGKRTKNELAPLQRAYSRFIARQEKALLKPCPRCQGQLQREQIHILKCSQCNEEFYVDDLLAGTAK